jgi:hypothetical protein
MEWVLVATFGALFGAGELVPRYRDAPMWILGTGSAWLYLGINGAASVAALALIRALGWDFSLADGTAQNLVQILIAGFGAMGLFRSSIFVAHVGDEDVPVGPITVLRAGLNAADRGVDRKRAKVRAKVVEEAMQGVTLQQAVVELPQIAFNLMQNVTSIEKARLADAAADVTGSDFDERTKVYVLGLALLTMTGSDTLNAAVALLSGPQVQAAGT